MTIQSKLDFVQLYINQCEHIIVTGETDVAKQLFNEIIGTFDSDIKNIKFGLDSFSEERRKAVFFNRRISEIDYISELKILKSKLIKLKIDLQDTPKDCTPLISLMQVQNQATNVQVDFEMTISAVEKLSESSLSQEDKEILLGKLSSLKGCLDKKTKWDKCKKILKWIADKSADAAIAVLPYIIDILKKQ